jgi:hypothetical protein
MSIRCLECQNTYKHRVGSPLQPLAVQSLSGIVTQRMPALVILVNEQLSVLKKYCRLSSSSSAAALAILRLNPRRFDLWAGRRAALGSEATPVPALLTSMLS